MPSDPKVFREGPWRIDVTKVHQTPFLAAAEARDWQAYVVPGAVWVSSANLDSPLSAQDL